MRKERTKNYIIKHEWKKLLGKPGRGLWNTVNAFL